MAWYLVKHRENIIPLSSTRSDLGPTQPPPIQWVQGALPLGVKRPEYETKHSSAFSAGVKHAWRYTFTPNFTFTVTVHKSTL